MPLHMRRQHRPNPQYNAEQNTPLYYVTHYNDPNPRKIVQGDLPKFYSEIHSQVNQVQPKRIDLHALRERERAAPHQRKRKLEFEPTQTDVYSSTAPVPHYFTRPGAEHQGRTYVMLDKEPWSTVMPVTNLNLPVAYPNPNPDSVRPYLNKGFNIIRGPPDSP